MHFRLIFRCVMTCVTLLFSSLNAHEEVLKVEDIHNVMGQIFEQHVTIKQMTSSILKNGLKTYIEQFDPGKIYLLESEARPYFKLDEASLAKILAQYNNNDYSAYLKLNELIVKTIERAREYRKTLVSNPTLLTQDLMTPKVNHEEEYHLFSKDLAELQARIKLDMLVFLAQSLKHDPQEAHKAQFLETYDKKMRSEEDLYIGTNEDGTPLSKIEKENLFALHVLKSLTSSMDAHTKVFDNTEAYDMKIRLEKGFHGIGIRVQQRNDNLVIVGLLEDGPAAKNGQIKVNDRIIKINGRPVSHESFDRALGLLRSDDRPDIELVLERGGDEKEHVTSKTFTVQLKREDVTINEGRVETQYEPYKDGIIGKITLHMFYKSDKGISSAEDVKKAIQQLRTKGKLLGLILDLRDNGGGFLNQAVKVAGLFITSGVIVVSKYSNGQEQVYRDTDGKDLYEGPLIVLTSRWTASAAEIVAQALQDYGVALVVGDEQTYGKGTIQSQTVTDNGSSSFFKVTVGKYYTVSGKTPQMQGVKADIVVPSKYSFDQIGEEFLDHPIPPDTIPAEYTDDFQDVEPRLHSWYMQYYKPNIQHKSLQWKLLVPVLRKKSAERIKHNKAYQNFIEKSKHETNDALQPFGKEDLQMQEAENILKDMIQLE